MPVRAASSTRGDRAYDAVRAALGDLFAAQRRLRGRDAQQKGDLSNAQFHFVRTLAEQGGELSASRLAERAALTPTTVTQMLDQLAAQGIIERVRSEEDRRVVFARLTPAGRVLYERKRAWLDARWREAIEDLGPEELERAAECLRRVAQVIDAL